MNTTSKLIVLFVTLASLNVFAAENQPAASASSNVSKDWNFRFGPVGLLIGLVNLEMDYKINNKFTIGPSLAFWNLKLLDVTIRASSIGVQGRYFFDEVYTDSWYGLGKIQASKVKAEIEDNGVVYTGEGSGGGLSLGLGYHWFWDSSFNMNLGFGVNTSTTKVKVKDSLGNAYKDDAAADGGSFLEFTLGWIF